MFNQGNHLILSVILKDDLRHWVEGGLGITKGLRGARREILIINLALAPSSAMLLSFPCIPCFWSGGEEGEFGKALSSKQLWPRPHTFSPTPVPLGLMSPQGTGGK